MFMCLEIKFSQVWEDGDGDQEVLNSSGMSMLRSEGYRVKKKFPLLPYLFIIMGDRNI